MQYNTKNWCYSWYSRSLLTAILPAAYIVIGQSLALIYQGTNPRSLRVCWVGLCSFQWPQN